MSNPLSDIIGFAGDALDVPGSVFRGLLAGEGTRAISGIMDPGQRVGGTEMLRNWGVLGPDSGFGGDLAGIAASIATDPLTLLGGWGALKGASKLGKLRAGRGLAAAGEEASPLLKGLGVPTLAPVAEAGAALEETSPILKALGGSTAEEASSLAKVRPTPPGLGASEGGSKLLAKANEYQAVLDRAADMTGQELIDVAKGFGYSTKTKKEAAKVLEEAARKFRLTDMQLNMMGPTQAAGGAGGVMGGAALMNYLTGQEGV